MSSFNVDVKYKCTDSFTSLMMEIGRLLFFQSLKKDILSPIREEFNNGC